jgi:hypothetical protein
LQHWYLSQCNDTWEHRYGVSIETLDNPGWSVRVDLAGTSMDHLEMREVGQLSDVNHIGISGIQDWLFCRVENNVFIGIGGPLSLFSICDAFRRWVENRVGGCS